MFHCAGILLVVLSERCLFGLSAHETRACSLTSYGVCSLSFEGSGELLLVQSKDDIERPPLELRTTVVASAGQ